MEEANRSNAESHASDSQSREGLLRELDQVIQETRSQISEDAEELKRFASRIMTDSQTYRSSVQIRNRYAHGDPIEPEFVTLFRAVSRFLFDLDRPKDEGSFRTTTGTFSREGSRAGGRSPMSADRLEQIRRVLVRNKDRPMGTGEITEAMASRGWLRDVADPRATVSAALSRGVRVGILERVSRGTYQLASSENVQEGGFEGGDQDQPKPIARKENSDREDVSSPQEQ